MSETPLDSLYGKGASSAFRKATGGSIDEVTLDAVGGVRVYVDWDDGSVLKIDCYPERVHFLSLTSKRKGLYSELCDTLPDLFRDRGVKVFTAYPANDEAEAVLRKRGEWDDAMRWAL